MANKTRFAEGKFEAEIVGQGITTASTGTLQLYVEITIDGFDNGVTIFLPVTPKTEEYVAKKLAVMGFTGDSVEQFSPDNPRHCSVIGKRIPVKNKHEEYHGNISDKFDVRTPFERKEATAAETRSKTEGLNKHLRAQKAAAPKTADVQQVIDDSDIPF